MSAITSEAVARSRGACPRRRARLSSRRAAQKPRAISASANCKVTPERPHDTQRHPSGAVPKDAQCPRERTLARRRGWAPRRQAASTYNVEAHKEETATRVSPSSRSSSQSLPTSVLMPRRCTSQHGPACSLRSARRGPARRRLRRTWGPRRLRSPLLLGDGFASCALRQVRLWFALAPFSG